MQTFTEAIRIDPKFPDSYSERGQALFKLGETERAIADYSAAIQRNPQHGAALRARGMAYLYRGSNDLALADLSRAIDLAANDPSLMAPIELFYARRSRATIYGSRLQYDREIADCTALIESYLRDPSVTQALKEGLPGCRRRQCRGDDLPSARDRPHQAIAFRAGDCGLDGGDSAQRRWRIFSADRPLQAQ